MTNVMNKLKREAANKLQQKHLAFEQLAYEVATGEFDETDVDGLEAALVDCGRSMSDLEERANHIEGRIDDQQKLEIADDIKAQFPIAEAKLHELEAERAREISKATAEIEARYQPDISKTLKQLNDSRNFPSVRQLKAGLIVRCTDRVLTRNRSELQARLDHLKQMQKEAQHKLDFLKRNVPSREAPKLVGTQLPTAMEKYKPELAATKAELAGINEGVAETRQRISQIENEMVKSVV